MITSKGKADILFCLDASGSMGPCFDAVRNHIQDLIAGLKAGNQISWDLRYDFIAHSADFGGHIFRLSSLNYQNVVDALYRRGEMLSEQQVENSEFFTDDIEMFKQKLQQVNVKGDESPLIALDTCLDFPWRESEQCHRIVVLMTDEPFESGAALELQKSKLDELIDKIMNLKVMLFIVAPDSEIFDELSSADKCEYTAVDAAGNGLSTVDFKELLSYIGKSVSKSNLQQAKIIPSRGLYDQATWTKTTRAISGN